MCSPCTFVFANETLSPRRASDAPSKIMVWS